MPQLVGHPLDQQVSEANALQPGLAVRDRVEDCDLGIARIEDIPIVRKDTPNRVRHLHGHGNFHENQRFVRHFWLEIGEAPAVGRVKQSLRTKLGEHENLIIRQETMRVGKFPESGFGLTGKVARKFLEARSDLMLVLAGGLRQRSVAKESGKESASHLGLVQ